MEEFKKVMLEAADEAAKILMEYFDTDFKISRKEFYNDLVTEVDKKSEEKIVEIIHKHFPDHNVLAEEGGNRHKKSDYVWIVDPIDGTVNYAHSLQIFCISIALEVKGEIMLGIVYNPHSGEKFFAEKGKGAWYNDKKISVSDTESLKDGFLVTGFAYGLDKKDDHSLEYFVEFVKMGLPVRRLGSAAIDICYVACGKFDAFWEFNLHAWDVAAAYLILLEAGGRITDFSGGSYSVYDKQILASNGRGIHDEMINVLKKVNKRD
ncbi:MAG: inositol monophosphatase family protein [Ignavibacteria bacterium]